MRENEKFRVGVLNSLIQKIDALLKSNLSIEDLSNITGYSRWYLQRIFKQHFGISPGTYIRKRRVEKAAYAITHEHNRIIDVVIDYNFSSQASFCRTFKSIFGVPPTYYKSKEIKRNQKKSKKIKKLNH
ncbi:helix-turn-helix transcriptional regulator [Enterobacter hormaechei]|uniref:helix-turn-helix transcriptional regulator n=1 Tax=Enterobacter hormaechei TaxID=158836 RepID=UPI00266574F3|nr:helix-turn-helix transcriptional regulator [Enterobacter hormaechei]MDO2398489.1 helix-turn-helix transcriptional regulator [Enterobacter hormaechei]MDO2406750.1 helix-turn-helix transcriptional regulator [Enterobacter hormaechei]MDO2417814.1 helix-turn-helix transcriptional regulator [Enterobacter hormaechei]MDO2427433.1 helix-turn-helix transcriptional regulator [Enterobacter hormaechei]